MLRLSLFVPHFIFTTLLVSCLSAPFSKGDLKASFKVMLPHELDEISGLAFDADSNILAINDEQGIVFKINPSNGVVLGKRAFKKKGDFEGLAFSDNKIYALESNGDLFEIQSNGQREKYELFEAKDFEFEGLCKKGASHLLLACKHHKSKKKDKAYIWVYEFNIDQQKLSDEPFLRIERGEALKNFKPSAIEFNARTKELMLLSAASRELLIINHKQSIKKIYQLNQLDLPQAEGLLLDDAGGVYIATEKNSFEFAKLLYFEAKNF